MKLSLNFVLFAILLSQSLAVFSTEVNSEGTRPGATTLPSSVAGSGGGITGATGASGATGADGSNIVWGYATIDDQGDITNSVEGGPAVPYTSSAIVKDGTAVTIYSNVTVFSISDTQNNAQLNLAFGSNVTIYGDLIIPNGGFDMVNATLTVHGNVYSAGWSDLTDSTLTVDGNVTFDGRSQANYLSIDTSTVTVSGQLTVKSMNQDTSATIILDTSDISAENISVIQNFTSGATVSIYINDTSLTAIKNILFDSNQSSQANAIAIETTFATTSLNASYIIFKNNIGAAFSSIFIRDFSYITCDHLQFLYNSGTFGVMGVALDINVTVRTDILTIATICDTNDQTVDLQGAYTNKAGTGDIYLLYLFNSVANPCTHITVPTAVQTLGT